MVKMKFLRRCDHLRRRLVFHAQTSQALSMKITLLIVLSLAVCVILPFAIWGDTIESWIVIDTEAKTLANSGKYAWLAGIGLLIADIFIPIPTTSIVAGLGIIYGPVFGAVVAVIGSMLSAIIGYCLGRFLGRPVAVRFAGNRLGKGDKLVQIYGGWIVAASRWLPVLPEVVSVVAGAHRMPAMLFFFSALCGVIPFSFAFAAIGHVGSETPIVTLLFAACVPILLWLLLYFSGFTRRFGAAENR